MLTESDTTQSDPYATAARLYRAAGWHGVFPVGHGRGEKWPPPRGFTGHGAPDPSGADIEAWIETHGDHNIGLRAPLGVLGLDVDAYEKGGKLKTGAAELARLEVAFGPLPPTWVSSARPAPSGIRWFRVPTLLDGAPVNWPGEAAPGIELIQHGHRYAVAWPSTNPEADGARYGWRLGEHPLDGPERPHVLPRPIDLAELPEPWVRGLSLGYQRTEKTTLKGTDLAAWFELLRPGAPPCPRVGECLARAVERVRLGEAGRHETARDTARALAAYGGEGHAGAGEALTELRRVFVTAVAAPGRDAEAEWLRLVTGAVELAAADNPAPRQLCACSPPSVLAPAPPVPLVVVPIPLPDEAPEGDALTDAAIVDRAHAELLAGRYLWANGMGWMQWDGMRWRECPDETVVEDVRLWSQSFVKTQLDNVFIAAQREQRNLLVGLLSTYRLTSIVKLARGLCQVDPAAFDAHADLLNTASGIVDLRTGELLPHDPVMRMTRLTAVAYDPLAAHADWPAALTAVRPDVADWLQIRFGQSITGTMTPDDVLLLLRGGGENGKSTVLNAIKKCLGSYATYVSDRVLLADPGSHPTELMDFRGARLAITEELPDEARLNVKRLKDVIGTPVMKARRMRKDPVEFAATHSMFLSTNYMPVVTDTDHGTWRRLALVEFPYRFVAPPDEPDTAKGQRRGDPGLRDRLLGGQRQHEAVLAWLVAGAVRWYVTGMPPHPSSVVADTQAWRAKSDPIEGFWSERLRPAPASFITSADMTAAFNDYLTSIGQREWSDRRFVPQFADHTTTRAHGVEYRVGKVKVTDQRSYRVAHGPGALSPFVPEPTATGKVVRAWWGVRFVTHNEPELQE